MAEAQIGPGKTGIAGLHRSNTNFALFVHHVPRKNLLRQRHGAFFSLHWRQEYFLLHPRHVERKQPTVLNYLPRNLILSLGKLGKRNLLPTANSVDQRKVSRSEHAQILAILLVDALNVLRNHHFDPRAHLGVRRLLAARTLSPPLSAHPTHKPAALDFTPSNRRPPAALQPKIKNLAQRLVKIKAVVRRS